MNEQKRGFFDSHIHLDRLGETRDLEADLQLARREGIDSFLIPGVERRAWPGLVELCHRIDGAVAAPGLHPLHAGQWNDDAAAELEDLCAGPRVVAIGEVGLEDTPQSPEREIQERAFVGQIRLAVNARMPLVIHCRNAIGPLLEILRRERAERVGGILHGFSGSTESARQAADMGFAIGLGAPLTYPEARKAPQMAAELDPDWLLLETDAPDRAPHPHRDETNRPHWLLLVAKALAELRGWSLEETAERTAANARRVLGLHNADKKGTFTKADP